MTRVAFHENRKIRAPRVASVYLSNSKAQAHADSKVRTLSHVTIVLDHPLSVPNVPAIRGGAQLRTAQFRKIFKAVAEALEREQSVGNHGNLMHRTNDTGHRGEVAASGRTCAGETKSDIDVGAVTGLWAEVEHLADEQNLKFPTVARDCFEHGLAVVSARVWDESPRALLNGLLSTYDERFEGSMEQRSFTVSRSAYLEAVLLAQEQGVPLSQLACIFLTAGLEHHAVA